MKALLLLLAVLLLVGCAPRLDGCAYITQTAVQAADALDMMQWGATAGDTQWATALADLEQIEARFRVQRAPRGTAEVALAMEDYLVSERRWVTALIAGEEWDALADEAMQAAFALERAVRLARIELGCPRVGR